MKTLVLASQAGGVGKSAVATLLAHCLVQHGQRVLAIDLDHQGNFSKPLRVSKRPAVATCTADALMTGGIGGFPSAAFVLVPSDQALLDLERQPAMHTPFACNFRAFLTSVDAQFDVCVIDTNPNPDLRLIAALASADFVLLPIQLNQEAMNGVHGLLNHDRVGVHKIKALLNPKLQLIGLLPTLVEPPPFQRGNFVQVVQMYGSLLIQLGTVPGAFTLMPRRSAIAETQASGEVLWEMKKTAARAAWKEIEPGVARITSLITTRETANATSTRVRIHGVRQHADAVVGGAVRSRVRSPPAVTG